MMNPRLCTATAAVLAMCWLGGSAPAAAQAPSPPPPPPAQAAPPAPPPVTQARIALGAQAWDVLKKALIEETLHEKYVDFTEGAGAESLKKLSPTSYLDLMGELARSPEAKVRRRAIVTVADLKGPTAVIILKKALSDPDLAVRMEAAAVLGTRGDRSVLKIYRAGMRTRNRDARFAVLQSLKRIPYKWVVNEIRVFLHDSDPFVRVSAAETLCRLGDEKGFMQLRRAMRSRNKYLRSNAYAAVAQSAGERLVPMLAKALYDKDPKIRLFAAVYLARNNSVKGLHALKAAMKGKDETLRYTVIDALARLKDSRGMPLLLLGLEDRSEDVRLLAAEALFARGKSNGVAIVAQALRSERASVRLKAVAAARAGCPGPGEALLQQALSDRSRSVRLAAIEALSSLSGMSDRARLRTATKDGYVRVRVAAALLLVRLGDPQGTDVLKSFVAETAPEREEAARALEQMNTREAIPFLALLASQGTDPERLRAIRALGTQADGTAAEALDHIARSDAPDALKLASVEAMGQVKGDLATYLLKRFLEPGTPSTLQYAAAASLGDRGVRSAVPVLKQALAENNLRAARALCKMGDPSGAEVYRAVLSSPDLAERIEAAVVLYRLDRIVAGAG